MANISLQCGESFQLPYCNSASGPLSGRLGAFDKGARSLASANSPIEVLSIYNFVEMQEGLDDVSDLKDVYYNVSNDTWNAL